MIAQRRDAKDENCLFSVGGRSVSYHHNRISVLLSEKRRWGRKNGKRHLDAPMSADSAGIRNWTAPDTLIPQTEG